MHRGAWLRTRRHGAPWGQGPSHVPRCTVERARDKLRTVHRADGAGAPSCTAHGPPWWTMRAVVGHGARCTLHRGTLVDARSTLHGGALRVEALPP